MLSGETSSTHLLAASLHIRMFPSFDCPAEGYGPVKKLLCGASALQAAGRANTSSLQTTWGIYSADLTIPAAAETGLSAGLAQVAVVIPKQA